ncbi:response regulator transcription factor [Sphingomonas sp. ASV193]|uniref:response regulator transcription factor n=1 Tax=Sphingomonas sp. ASV193 TaxID=3144405 RepID=UPI0032E84F93
MARIILVDDEPIAAQIAAGALAKAGYAVGWIDNGAEALQVMRRRPPDLAILDCMMPGMSGVQLLHQMRIDMKLCGVPVLMLTARTSARDEAIAFGAGAGDYLTKPFDPDLLVGRVDALLYRERTLGRMAG